MGFLKTTGHWELLNHLLPFLALEIFMKAFKASH